MGLVRVFPVVFTVVRGGIDLRALLVLQLLGHLIEVHRVIGLAHIDLGDLIGDAVHFRRVVPGGCLFVLLFQCLHLLIDALIIRGAVDQILHLRRDLLPLGVLASILGNSLGIALLSLCQSGFRGITALLAGFLCCPVHFFQIGRQLGCVLLACRLQLFLALRRRTAGINRNHQQEGDGNSCQHRPLALAEPDKEEGQDQGAGGKGDAPFEAEGIETDGQRHTEYHTRQEAGDADIRRTLSFREGLRDTEQEAENEASALSDAANQENRSRHADHAFLPALGNIEEAVNNQGDGDTHQETRQGPEAVEGEALKETAEAASESGKWPAAFDEERHDQRIEQRGDQNLADDAADGADRPAEQAALCESKEIGPGQPLAFPVAGVQDTQNNPSR